MPYVRDTLFSIDAFPVDANDALLASIRDAKLYPRKTFV